MLTRITICGADDDVDPRGLLALSQRFPFVEWGILVSNSRSGSLRYPRPQWLNALYSIGRDMNLAVHFCGGLARNLAAGDVGPCERYIRGTSVQRVQLNGVELSPPFRRVLLDYQYIEFIVQIDGYRDLVAVSHYAGGLANARISGLFDASHGEGKLIEDFPFCPPGIGFRLGYAGGIGPVNIEAIARRFESWPTPAWLCMETSVRIDNEWSWERVEETLTRVEPYIEKPPAKLTANYPGFKGW